ncbi:ABC transporter ATP-binding protein [Arabiibacter massiliensis]|uniref:ABC transporter ATP-binding protein n=1 Tax=Arabiibacter massiliensis TaxID=1870985 RepID=UPI0009BB8E3C|nr:ABC transporter ATP-binding protein [Arabiibacter massiliensis]
MTAQHAARPAQTVVEVRGISKRYGGDARKRSEASVTQALDRVSLTVASGEFVGIMGPSGSGKSTLLNCLATIDAPTSGQIVIGGRTVTNLHGKELARFRRDDLGFIFQDANLLDTLTAYENIALALTIQKTPPGEIDARVREAARQLGIEEVLEKHPFQMSGGQRQRVAAARATVTRPHLVLADEPTGALDSKSAAALLESLEGLNARGATILMVTHDAVSASYCGRIVFIKDGRLYGELRRQGTDRSTFYRRIVDIVTGMGGDAEGALAHAC